MDQSIIPAFKALYTRNALQNLIEAMDSDKDFSLKAYWHDYTIALCLLNIPKSIKAVKSETLNASWKNLWLEVVHDYKGFSPDEVYYSAVDKAMKLAKLLAGDDFNDMTPDDVNHLINAHSQPLMDDDLTEMTKSTGEKEEEELGVEEEEEVGLTLYHLATKVRMAKELQQVTQEWDPQMLRSSQISNTIEGGISVYKNILAQKKKQHQELPITMFLTRRKTTVTPTPLAKTEVMDKGKDTAPPDEAPDEVVPSEEL